MKLHALILSSLLAVAGCEKTSNVTAIQDEVTGVTNHYKQRFEELSKRLATLEQRGRSMVSIGQPQGLQDVRRLFADTNKRLAELKNSTNQVTGALATAAKSENARVELIRLRDEAEERFEKGEVEVNAQIDQIEQWLAYLAYRPTVAATAEPAPEPAPPTPAPPTESGFTTKLSSGTEIKGASDGIEAQLFGFLSDAAKPVDKDTWFNFDKLSFASGGNTLDMAVSKPQLDNIAAVLKAFPKVKIKLGGYTDNTGDAAANKKLSGERAEAVKKELIALGVEAGRLSAEGYGPEHPVCAANDTDDCKAKNRRIAIRVTEK